MGEVEREIRRLHRKISQTEQRLARASLRGEVTHVDAAKRLCRVKIGETADSQPVLSPWVSWREPSNGLVAHHTPMRVGDQVTLESPSGTIGKGSIANRTGYSGSSPAPSSAADAAVDKAGDLTITTKEGAFEIVAGGVTWTFDGSGLKQVGGAIEHDGHAIDKTHLHTDVMPGPALTGPPA